MRAREFITEGVAGPKKCWPGHRKTGTQPGTGKNKGKRVNDCEKIKNEGVAEGALNEFYRDPDDDEESPLDNYPCYDCGSTIYMHHTELCDLAEDDAIRDLPSKAPGLQHWSGEIPKGLKPIPGLQESFDGEYDDEAGVAEGKKSTLDLEFRIRRKDNEITIYADNDGVMVGYVRFNVRNDTLVAGKVSVDPDYRRHGIATDMYNYAENLGYKIIPSESQTELGREFWKKRSEEGLAEATGDTKFDSMMGGITSRGSLDTREALALMRDLIYNGGASYEEALQQASASFEISPGKLNALYNNQGVAEGLTPDQMFDIIEEMVEHAAAEHGVDPELIWEELESVDDIALFESAAWRRKEGKNKKGGLNAKGVASYRRENPGSKLQTAVTTKPSKLKKGSKAAKRRKSFCARMGGVKGPMKKDGKPTRKALALRKWNC